MIVPRYLFKLRLGGGYEWNLVDLDPASLVPPGRTLHSACGISEDEVFVFGGVHSATPYQCLADGWLLDTTCMEWKKMQFKAAQVNKRSSAAKRMSGPITECVQEVNAAHTPW